MKIFLSSLVAVLPFICVVDAGKVTRPTYFPTCTQSDPEIEKCMLAATEEVREHLIKGVPELKLQPIEPFNVPEINIEQGTKSLNVIAKLTNVLIHGLSHYKFKKFEIDFNTWDIKCEATVPDIVIEGDYEMDGKILVAPLKGKGRFTISIDATHGNFNIQGHIVDKKGVKYVNVKELPKTTLQVEKPKVHFDGLFGDNKEVGEVTNKVINDNADEIFNDLKGIIENIVSSIVADLIDKIVSNLPVDVIFPPK